MKIISCTFLLLLAFAFKVNAQQLLFINQTNNKVITVNIGSKLMLTYKGYNGNNEFYSQLVTDINDSTITLGSPWLAQDKDNKLLNSYKVIRLADITAFKKRSLGAELSKSVLQLGLVVGSFFMFDYITQDMTKGSAFLVTIGTGLAINIGINAIYKENAKYKMANGWSYRFIKENAPAQ